MVDIVGKVFISPEKDVKGTYWQMWSDPKNNEWNTAVAIADPNFQISNDDYVHVVGTVKGKVGGKNAFGADVTAVGVLATKATVVGAIAAASPAQRVVHLDAQQTQNGITIRVTKMEFATDETRVFVSVSNGSNATAHFYDFDAKAVQGTSQFSAESFTDYPSVQSDILTGVTSTGVVVFPTMSPNQLTTLVFNAGSDNYNLTFQPYRFDVQAGNGAGSPSIQTNQSGTASPTPSSNALINAAISKSNETWIASSGPQRLARDCTILTESVAAADHLPTD